ncbi:riboflavin synthase [Bacillus andreraoultii]|uniref:riboflavin synthase n=1 Tax=Bacillus andreraoultii TaxID=1499685 RepID=UPI00053B5C02|nr:riboflavin synthase [Bacillus andreraoultii]
MFTGIVEELGTIQSITKKRNTLALTIQGKKVLEEVQIGDSIAVNGVCLTVTTFDANTFQVDVMPETFNATSLSVLKRGCTVNLEQAMAANGRFGGHFVTGHVDGIGTILKREPHENAIYYHITYPSTYRHLLLMKGSIAVDGTSLTVFGIDENYFTVSIIPHTGEQSVIGLKKVGDIVNLEFDLIGKYLHQFLLVNHNDQQPERISKAFLQKNGFI